MAGLDFEGDVWTRAFWEHMSHLRIVCERHGQPVRVLRPRSCIACWRLYEAAREREGPHEVGRARAAFRVTLTE